LARKSDVSFQHVDRWQTIDFQNVGGRQVFQHAKCKLSSKKLFKFVMMIGELNDPKIFTTSKMMLHSKNVSTPERKTFHRP
jgi:hypothetical protein